MNGMSGLLATLFFAVVVVPLFAYLFVRFLALLEIWETRADLRRRTMILYTLTAVPYSFMAIVQFAKDDADPYLGGLALVLAIATGAMAIRQWRSDPEPVPDGGNLANGDEGSPAA